MAKEVARPDDTSRLRAADTDRQRIAELLKAALDEGRLSLHEYDDRVGLAYAARTYADLKGLIEDLPAPGLSAQEVESRRLTEERRAARRLPLALMVLWTIYGSLLAVNLMIWFIVWITVSHDLYFWPAWLLVPGAALAATTAGVQSIRRQRHH